MLFLILGQYYMDFLAILEGSLIDYKLRRTVEGVLGHVTQYVTLFMDLWRLNE